MLPPHTLVVEDFGEFRELIQSWIEGHYELMVILGGAASASRKPSNARCPLPRESRTANGRISRARSRRSNCIRRFTIIDCCPSSLNDVDTLLKDETSVSLLKCVCDTSKVRRCNGPRPRRLRHTSKELRVDQPNPAHYEFMGEGEPEYHRPP